MPIHTSDHHIGIDLDHANTDIGKGFVVDGSDVKIKSDKDNGLVYQNFRGNDLKVTVPDIVAQNKKWFISQGIDGGDSYILTLYDALGNVLATASNAGFGGIQSDFETALGVATVTFNKVTGTWKGHDQITYEFTGFNGQLTPYYNFTLVSSGKEFQYFYLVSEAIDDSEAWTDYTAIKKPISAIKGLTGTYVFYTNHGLADTAAQFEYKETIFNGIGSVFGTTGGGTTGQVFIKTNLFFGRFGSVNGQYIKVKITNSTVPAYNGVQIAQLATVSFQNGIILIDRTFSTDAGLTVTPFVSKYGEVGFIDNITASYTKLWSTTQWDFSVLRPVNSRVEPQSLGYDALYWSNGI